MFGFTDLKTGCLAMDPAKPHVRDLYVLLIYIKTEAFLAIKTSEQNS